MPWQEKRIAVVSLEVWLWMAGADRDGVRAPVVGVETDDDMNLSQYIGWAVRLVAAGDGRNGPRSVPRGDCRVYKVLLLAVLVKRNGSYSYTSTPQCITELVVPCAYAWTVYSIADGGRPSG